MKTFTEFISEGSSWDALASDMQKIVKKYKKHEVGADSVKTGSGYGNSTARATRSGFIMFEEDVTVHGYSFNTHLYYAIKVGGNVDQKIHKKIKDEVEKLVAKYDNLIINGQGDTKYGIMSKAKDGTNFSTYGVQQGNRIKEGE